MKLLLTSAGIRNKSLAKALVGLVGKDVKDIKIGYIPTAANVEPGNKDWYIDQFVNLREYGFTWIDVIDISAPEVRWQKRLEDMDVVLVSGGNTFHLLDQVRKTGFDEWLVKNLDKKIYVGISAGSIIVTPSIAIASVDEGDVNYIGISDLTGLSLVDFEVSPHTPENVSHEGNEQYLKATQNTLYGMDNETAVQVVDGEIEVISEGEWIKY